MKILHVIHSLDPRSGGPSHVLRQMVRYQVRAGHEVLLLATSVQSAEPWGPGDAYRESLLSDPAFAGAEVHVAEAWGRRKPWSVYAYSPASRSWLRSTLTDPQRAPQVVHIHGIFSHVTTLAARYARRQGIPYVIRPAGTLNARCLGMGSGRLKKLYYHLFLWKDLKHAALLHATSSQEADELRRWVDAERVRVIPHGVEIPTRNELAAAAVAFYRRFPDLKGRRVVLFLGRLAAKKRPELLIEALARLRSQGEDLVLLLVGSDDGGLVAVMEAAKRHGLERAVVSTGFLDGELKRGALAISQCFALPSLDENFGVAVVEAMAHGLPVILTREVAASAYVDQSGGGATVVGTPEGFACGIGDLLRSDPRTVGERGRSFVEQHLSWPSIIAELESLYRESAAASTGGVTIAEKQEAVEP